MPSNDPDPRPLARLRREIEALDRAIVVLLSARLREAERAVRVRAPRTGSVTDAAQERRILDRGVRWARELDVPEELVELLFRQLVAAGKARYLRTGPARRTALELGTRGRHGAKALSSEAGPRLVPVAAAR